MIKPAAQGGLHSELDCVLVYFITVCQDALEGKSTTRRFIRICTYERVVAAFC